jgi:hypothetical protein
MPLVLTSVKQVVSWTVSRLSPILSAVFVNLQRSLHTELQFLSIFGYFEIARSDHLNISKTQESMWSRNVVVQTLPPTEQRLNSSRMSTAKGPNPMRHSYQGIYADLPLTSPQTHQAKKASGSSTISPSA